VVSQQRVLSPPAAVVLRRFVDAPEDELHGFRIIKETGIPPGTLYPVLRLLGERRGYLRWRWEDIDPRVEKRPPRRFYRLDGDAELLARQELARFEAHQRCSGLGRLPIPEQA
jgi:PadR family transcriptional regulator, regulatory protein PadR